MLVLTFSELEFWDGEGFLTLPEKEYSFEHSLISISRWEAIYEKPFLTETDKTPEEIIEYIKCMCLDPSFDTRRLTNEIMPYFNAYINKRHTATKIVESKKGTHRGRIMTSEVIYAYMSTYHIPYNVDRWNINRLLMLLAVLGELNDTEKKKLTPKEIYAENKRINEMNKKKYNTKG